MSERNKPLLRDITGGIFRANPQYELVLFDRLPPEQKALLADLQEDSDLYGILRPKEQAGLGLKSVCRDTALLYLTLDKPGALPAYVRTMFAERCNQAIAELVLDRVLGIDKDGLFVSGSDAYELLYETRQPVEPQGFNSTLSMQALQYAQALEVHDVSKLSARMYFYNRVPASPDWMRRFPTPDFVGEYLGVDEHGWNRRLLRQNWSPVVLSPPYSGWRMWRSSRKSNHNEELRTTYKLYVSPTCDAIKDAFQSTLQILTEVEAPRFKIGHDVYGLLRPDKIVAYFWSFGHLMQTAERLQRKLAGIPAQGVPFTATIMDDGLLSWGMDPPRDQQALTWMERESWRLWITNRLATALLSARAAKSGAREPWQFALDRLRLEGVNTDSWIPDKEIWEKGSSTGK